MAYKDKKRRKRIVDLEVDERSLVDKPAIGEEFYLFKRNGAEENGMKIKDAIAKAAAWGADIQKSDEPETCLFCKEEGGREPKVGLRCSVCFSCAAERADHGVFDQCLEGTFKFDEYQEKYSDDIKTKQDDTGGEKEDDKDKSETKDPEKDDKKEDPKKESEEEEAESEEDQDADTESEEKTSAVALNKQVGELKDLLEQSLSLHDGAAQALNQVVIMLMAAMEQIAHLGGSQDSTEKYTEITDQIAAVRKEIEKEQEVSKVGAKISGSRMATLQDIATKLSDLIRALGGVDKDKDAAKSVETLVSEKFKSVESTLLDLRDQSGEKLDELIKRVENLENTAGASGAIEEDEERSSTEKSDSQQSIFANLLGLDEIRMQKSQREKFLNRS